MLGLVQLFGGFHIVGLVRFFSPRLATAGICAGTLLFAPRALAQHTAERSVATHDEDASGPDDAPEEKASQAERDPSEEAVRAFLQGNEAFVAGHYLDAANDFERAFSLKPHAAALFNAAKAWNSAGRAERAGDLFVQALARGELAPAQQEEAQATLEDLRRSLGWVTVSATPDLTFSIGYKKDVSGTLTTHLAPGKHRITCITEEGRSFIEHVSVKAGEELSVSLQAPAEQPMMATTVVEEPPEPTRNRAQMTFGFVFLGAGAALGATSVGVGVAMLGANSDYKESGFTDPDLRQRALSLRTWSNVFAISGAVVGGTGLALLLTSKRHKEPRVGLGVGPGNVQVHALF